MSGQRLNQDRLLWLEQRLSARDWDVLQRLAELRLATGQQLEPLCFEGLSGHSRSVVRGRVLGRLGAWGLIEQLERRVGGAAKGSATAIYRLAPIGQALMQRSRPRATKAYSSRFTRHTLAVSQLRADLAAATAGSNVSVPHFVTEPDSWTPDGLGGHLKPDAYLQLQDPTVTLHYWVEVDRATESLPTLTAKLRAYLDFVARGQTGPHGLVPRVALSVSSDERLNDVRCLVDRLAAPADELFMTARDRRTALELLGHLRE